MPDTVDSATRSKIMALVRSHNTKPEIAVRKALHAGGYRFRLHRNDLPGKPDLVLPKYNIAIFVHGCFWHGHHCKRGNRIPSTNREYWLSKIGRNVARDRESIANLQRLGWDARVIWECELTEGIDTLLAELAEIRR